MMIIAVFLIMTITRLFLTHLSALCYLEWGGESVGMGDLLVAGTSDGRLGFIDVKNSRVVHVRRASVPAFSVADGFVADRALSRIMRHTSLCA